MRFNSKFLNIPPYISTTWDNVSSIQARKEGSCYLLVVCLKDNTKVEIPNLEGVLVEAIFAAHEKYQDNKGIENPLSRIPPTIPISSRGMETLVSFGFQIDKENAVPSDGLMGTLLQHSQEQYNSPDLPQEILNKISQLTKALGIEDANIIPSPEPHCNCPHCQVVKAMHKGLGTQQQEEIRFLNHPENEAEMEEISEEELTFRTWDICQKTDKLYTVSNPVNSKEFYNVYTGEPTGCTCGLQNCEHIHAVLHN